MRKFRFGFHFLKILERVNRPISTKNILKMPVFTQQLNPITGQNEWNLQQEDYDYKQEVARSSYADMLHDQERNEMYYEGIRRCIALLRSQKQEVHVLDIGTGTGLLSMMALSCGVDSVTACEAFTPMAQCARKILKINGCSEMVNLIGKRSTELECGEGKEMPRRANLLVTEVFDTELIGEGAIETFTHAKEYLLTPDALIVPCEATIYAQVVSSSLVKRWNKISPILDPSVADVHGQRLLSIPDSVENCPGAAAVHDIQLSEVSPRAFSAISKAIPVFEFDWSGRKIPLSKERVTHQSFDCLTSGDCDAVFMWWNLKMDPMGEVVLSCAPFWEHHFTRGKCDTRSSELPWRDHWMQAVYYLPKPLAVKESENVTLISSHDEYSLWFSISKDSSAAPYERPICECGLHATASRTRLGQLNDPRRTSLYVRVLKEHVRPETVCLFLSDCCLTAVVAAKLGARHVYIHQTNGVARRILNDFIMANKVEDRVTIISSHLSDISLRNLVGKISLVFSEPYFDTAMLPWHSLQFLYRLRSAKHLIQDDVLVLPHRLSIRGMPVQFRDLWKLRAPLDTCSGFKMEPFDEMIEKASEETDEKVEPQPLWEYPSVALGRPFTLLSLPLSRETFRESRSIRSAVPMEYPGILNGLALWAEWDFGAEECLTTGPVSDVTPGRVVDWDMYTRQGIYLFKAHHQFTADRKCEVICTTSFDPTSGFVNFEFGTDVL